MIRTIGRVVDDEVLLRAYDEQLRGVADTGRPGITVERDGRLTRVSGQRPGFVTGPRDLGVTGAELDALIERQREFFAKRGETVEWKTRGHDLPVDLPERLLAAGFVPGDQETVVVGAARDMAADPVLPEGVTLSEVADDASLREIAALESEVWGRDFGWLGDDLIARKADAPGDLLVFAVREETSGQVVSAAWLVFVRGSDFAGLWGGSTRGAWRGRGIYRALVAVRAQRALARGIEYLQADASDDSAPILKRLGFHPITTTTPYTWSPT